MHMRSEEIAAEEEGQRESAMRTGRLNSGHYLTSLARHVVAGDGGRACWIEQGLFVVVPKKTWGGIAPEASPTLHPRL